MKHVILVLFIAVAVLILLVAGGTFYVVDETQQVVITQFGEPIGDRVGVGVRGADQHAQPRADRTGDLPVGVGGPPTRHLGTDHTLHERSHRCSIA